MPSWVHRNGTGLAESESHKESLSLDGESFLCSGVEQSTKNKKVIILF